MTPSWLDSSRAQVLNLNARLPHALLIYGDPGVGKHLFAMEIIAALICDQAYEKDGGMSACGQCKNCVMFESGNHPDFHYISSERFIESSSSAHLSYAERYLEAADKRSKRKPRSIISVDQIRMLIDDFALSHHSSAHKVALIQPADGMNTNAANALLKLLEEPNPESILILVSDDPGRLPMTVRSRCIGLAVNTPGIDQSVPWLIAQGLDEQSAHQALAISGGAPLLALHYAQSSQLDHFKTLVTVIGSVINDGMSPIEARETIVKLQTPATLLSWLQMLVSWLIASVDASDQSRVPARGAFKREVSALSKRFGDSKQTVLFQLYDDLNQIKRQDVDVLNPGLMLDKWLISFARRLA